MPIFNKESLEALRQRVNLIEVLSSYVDLKRTGASYKGYVRFMMRRAPRLLFRKAIPTTIVLAAEPMATPFNF